MEKINVKINHAGNPLFQKIRVILFNVFAGFFNWFIILICLILLIVGYLWLLKPKYTFIASNQELTIREKEYEEKVTYLKQLNDIKNLYKSISQADKDKIDLILSSGQDLDKLKIILLREVDKVGKERGATVDNIVITPLDNSRDKFITISSSSKKKALPDKLSLVQVSFTAKNINYDQLKKLLVRLESSLRIMDVTDLTFDPSARETGIKLFTYYLQK